MGFVNETKLNLTSYDVLSLPHSRLKTKKRGGEYSSACPFCGEGTDRFLYWPQTGFVWCRQCGSKGFLSDAPEAQRGIYPQEIIAGKIKSDTPESSNWLKYHQDLFEYPEALAYWERELGPDFMLGVLSFGLGYCKNFLNFGASATMPVVIQDRVLVVYHRLLEQRCKDYGKYRPEPDGLGGMLFNLDDSLKYNKIILAEGIKKAIRIWLAGYPAISSTTGPIFDKAWDVFLNHKEIVIIYDPDEAGQNGAEHIAKRLKSVTSVLLPGKADDFLNAGGNLEEYIGKPWRKDW